MNPQYRIWQSSFNKYLSEEDFHRVFLTPTGRVLWQFRGDNHPEFEDITDRVVVEMYSGVEDENGKECYCNDICFYDDDSGKKQIGIVKWCVNLAAFYIRAIGGDDEGNQNGDLGRKFTIIGNRHENPELMEAKNEDSSD